MILQVLFYAELETFVLKRKFNSKSLDPPLKISGCDTALLRDVNSKNNLFFLNKDGFRRPLSKKKRFLKMTCFQKTFFQENLFFMVDKTKTFVRKVRRKKNVKSLFLLKTLTWAPDGYSPYEPGFAQSILKIFVINADSLFAKYGKLTTGGSRVTAVSTCAASRDERTP